MAVTMFDARGHGGPTMGRRRRVVALAVLAVLALLVQMGPLAPQASAAPPAIPMPVPASGVHVWATQWQSERTLRVHVESTNIASTAVHGSHYVFITFPVDYAERPDVDFPVLYLLHGGGGGKSSDWTTAGDVENITAGHDVITVMPDGGRVGWYTNWLNQNPAQRWADFHLNQLIPWVDANFRTNASKEGRAIAGLSMGGYGAIRYAQDRPDLFTFAASFSGAVDLGVTETRLVVWQQSLDNGFDGNGAFGGVFFGGVWDQHDPMKRAARLQGVTVRLYAGSGTDDLDIIERTMGASTDRFHHALNAAGVPHFYWMYGRPGNTVPYGCNGGHNYGCWNFALSDSMPEMMSVLQTVEPEGSIAGTLSLADGTAPAAAGACALPAEGDAVCAAAAADGTYRIDGVPVGDATVSFSACADEACTVEFSEHHDNATSLADATPVSVSEGVVTADVDAVLSDGIVGRVTDPDGNPVADVVVAAYTDADAFVPTGATTAGADGRFRFPDIEPGTYRLVVAPPAGSGFALTWHGSPTRTRADATPVPVQATAHGVDQAIVVSLAGALGGTVTYESGAPAAGAMVGAYGQGDLWLPSSSTRVEADGSYEFPALPVGGYRVVVVPPAGLNSSAVWAGSPVSGPATVHQVTSEVPLTAIDATLPVRSSLSGTVQLEGGAPAPGATVAAYGTDNGWLPRATATVATDGTFSFPTLQPDTYRLLVRVHDATSGTTLTQYWHAEPGVTDRRRSAAALIEVAPYEQVGGVTVVYPLA